MDAPWYRICPAEGRSIPLTARKVVVLPAPFAPISETISPWPTRMEMPRSAWIAP